MSTINPNYIVSPILDEVFFDQVTGAPLANGYIYFYSDNSRSTLKTIYTISGSPGSYTYVALPNPVRTNAFGNPIDGSGNNIAIYYYPYTIVNSQTVTELYYVVVFNSAMVQQFFRQGWPNSGIPAGSVSINYVNYIANGQFYVNNTINQPGNYTQVPGLITGNGPTNIAPGGWTYERYNSNATDYVTFPISPTYSTNPSASPRYACQVQCTNISSSVESGKYIAVKFGNVYKFVSSTPAQYYTIAFWGQNLNGGSVNIGLEAIYYFGSGGSPSTTIVQGIATFTLTGATTLFQQAYIFSLPSTYTLGTNNDDFFQLAITFPVNSIFNVVINDVILTAGVVTISQFPTTPRYDYLTDSVAGYMVPPSPTGDTMGLPLAQTTFGSYWDNSMVGSVTGFATFACPVGWLKCDGAQYLTSGYSSDGIPYSRLQALLYNQTSKIPIWGTGPNFMTATEWATDSFIVSNNTMGAVTLATDGTTPTGFTLSNIARQNTASNYYVQSWNDIGTANTFLVNCTLPGIVTAPTAGTSSFTVSSTIVNLGSANVKQLFYVTVTLAGLAGGQYFEFYSYNGTSILHWYVWWTVNGAGPDPAPAGGTGILVVLTATETTASLLLKLTAAINGFQTENIKTVAASGMTAGSFFNIYSTNQYYYVWYKINGVGIDPVPASGLGIQVNIGSGYTSAQVMDATVIAMNSTYFSVPNYYGQFLRGYDPNAIVDPNVGLRYSLVPGLTGTAATFQLTDVWSHRHTTTIQQSGASLAFNAYTYTSQTWQQVNLTSNYTGGFESRPPNANILWCIKY